MWTETIGNRAQHQGESQSTPVRPQPCHHGQPPIIVRDQGKDGKLWVSQAKVDLEPCFMSRHGQLQNQKGLLGPAEIP